MVGSALLGESGKPAHCDDRAARRRSGFATHDDIGESDWGEVTTWEPGRRLVHTFTLAQDPRAPSEVSVELVDGEEGCTLRFAHGGWTECGRAGEVRRLARPARPLTALAESGD